MLKILDKYLDYLDVFLIKKVAVLQEIIILNQYVIEFKQAHQLFYSSINLLRPVALKTLKIYIEINFTNSSI